METELKKAIESVMQKGAKYVDIRSASGDTTSIISKNGNLENITTGQASATGIRVLYKGSWGFASTNDISKLSEVSETAFRIAKSIQDANKNKEIMLAPTKIIEKTINNKFKIDIKDISIDDRVGFVREGYKGAQDVSSEIKSVSILYSDVSANSIFVNSEGSYITSKPQYYKYYVHSNARRGARFEESYDRSASFLGIDNLIKHDPAVIAKRASDNALRLLDAGTPPSGVMPVILHPSVGGVFVHEAVGHASEADHALRESIFTSKLGEKLGSSKLNIIDDPTLKGKHGSYGYDSEGVRGKRTEIFKNGVLKSYLHSRETAGAMGVESTGNARAQSPEFMPIVRMSNTYFDKGDMDTDEMFSGIKKGIYLEGFKGGQVDPTGGSFTFGVEFGYLIENGKKTNKLVSGCSMSGHILEVLKNIDAVGNKLSVDALGFCGKDGQSVPVDDGAPLIRVKDILVGGMK